MAETKRDILERFSDLGVFAGLCAAYGMFGLFAIRYLYPNGASTKRGWQFVIEVPRMKVGDSLEYIAPTGAKVAVARQANTGTVEDFVALSSTCPHLGCQVHWESNKERFFCPCHNGAFDKSGNPIAGPPAESKQSLPRYPLKIEKDLLYIDVPLEALASTTPCGISKPGHDRCLGPRSA